MELETIIYEQKDEVAIIKFNRPKVLNAQSTQLTLDFLKVLKEVEIDSSIKAVIIKGEGRAFCAGDDLSEDKRYDTAGLLKFVEAAQDTSRIMLRMGKPIIGAIHGYALGSGCEWAMNCDVRIAAEGTKFGFPETNVGATVTNAGTKILTLLVGFGRAKELVFTNVMIDANKAEQWGLVNKVVPLEELDKAAMDMAKDMANRYPLAIHLSKQALNQGAYQDFEQVLQQEIRDVIIAFSTGESAKRAKTALDKTKKK